MNKHGSEMNMEKKESSTRKTGLLRLPQVLELVPVSKSTLWNMVKEGRFPKPVKLSERCTCWRAADVYGFVDGLGGQ
jgi:predicted DNA-binding transcriptional regulator AlpA